MGYFEKYNQEEIQQIVQISTSFKDFARKIGYTNNPSGATIKSLKEKLQSYDTSHFQKQDQIERNVENIFTENSTASQNTLRRWFLKEEYQPYICSICGQLPIWNNKELTLILDHINECNNDNRLENLRWVCPNCNQQLETTGSRNPIRKKFAKKYYCIDCGKEISKGSLRCLECETKHRVIPIEEMKITREELKFLIRTMPFTQIAKKFNVSDNAIRKWCDKFNLPRKKSEIQKFSEEEWSKI